MKSRAKIIALAGILSVAGIGGTFAYFSQEKNRENVFNTGVLSTELVEEFRPEDGENWNPGSTVNKDVSIRNNGTLPVVVRVKFKETWTNTGNEADPSDDAVIYEADTTVPGTIIGSGEARNKFEQVFQSHTTDGIAGTEVDDSVVYKALDPESRWVYNPADGYYYYTEVLPGVTEDGVAAQTTKILDSITLAEDIDMGAFVERRYYATVDAQEEWKEFSTVSKEATASEAAADVRYVSTEQMAEQVREQGTEIKFIKTVSELLNEELTGYSNADYMLRIEAQTVQATDGAVSAVFGDYEELKKALGFEWTDLLSESDLYSGDEVKASFSDQ